MGKLDTTPDFDVLLAEFAPAYPVRCTVAKALKQLPDDQTAKVLAALGNDKIAGTAIAKALSAVSGLSISEFSLNRHRRKKCTCD